MLKVAIFLSFTQIVFCNANNVVGDYQLIVLTQYSPVIAYLDVRHEWPESEVKYTITKKWSIGARQALKNKHKWIIHEFYPFNKHTENPTNCPNEIGNIDAVSIGPLTESILQANWPIYRPADHEKEFWKDAWVRYGTCMTDLGDIKGPDGYFRKAAELFGGYNIGDILSNKGVKLERTYTLSEIVGKLSNLPVIPKFSCLPHENLSDRQYLFGATLCFDKIEKMVACPMTVTPPCLDNKSVIIR